MRISKKWLFSQAAGIIYGLLSLVFLWMTTRAVVLFDSFPEFFASDGPFIIAMLFSASIVLYILFVIINEPYVPDEHRKTFNILFVFCSLIYVVVPVCSRPSLFVSVVATTREFVTALL